MDKSKTIVKQNCEQNTSVIPVMATVKSWRFGVVQINRFFKNPVNCHCLLNVLFHALGRVIENCLYDIESVNT